MKSIHYLVLGLLLLIGCPGEVVNPDGGSLGDAMDVVDAGMEADASGDSQVKDVISEGDGGLNFDFWSCGNEPISYHDGPVMVEPIKIFVLWYGNWINNNKTVPIVEQFIIDLNGSPWFSTTSTYYETLPIDMIAPAQGVMGRAYATNNLILTKSVFISSATHGNNLSMSDVFAIVTDAINDQSVPNDPTAAYLVLTSSDINQYDGFESACQAYCGFHNHKIYNAVDVKFAWIGDPARCLDVCSAKSKYDLYGISHSPNFDWSADAMVSVIAHELTEIITDYAYDTAPAWTDRYGWENADKGAWTFGQVYKTDSGSVANVHLGDRDYLLQQNWTLFDGGQGCALHP